MLVIAGWVFLGMEETVGSEYESQGGPDPPEPYAAAGGGSPAVSGHAGGVPEGRRSSRLRGPIYWISTAIPSSSWTPRRGQPAPGNALLRRPRCLANYLDSRESIRYVAYTYKDERCYRRSCYDWQLRPGIAIPGIDAAGTTSISRTTLPNWARRGKRVFDDGDTFVADLCRCDSRLPGRAENSPGRGSLRLPVIVERPGAAVAEIPGLAAIQISIRESQVGDFRRDRRNVACQGEGSEDNRRGICF